MYRMVGWMVVISWCVAAGMLSAQAPVVMEKSGGDEAKSKAAASRHIGVLGASLSAGFGSEMRLVQALQAVTTRRHRFTDGADMMTFQGPYEVSEKAIAKVMAAKPEVVVALDYLFWFMYSRLQGGTARVAELDRALKLLEKIDVPVFLGMIPRITDAGRMIRAAQIPSQDELTLMTERVRAWAKDRPKVKLMSSDEWLRGLRTAAEVEVLGEKRKFTKKEILLDDNLHLAPTGIVVAAGLVAKELARHGVIQASEITQGVSEALKRTSDGTTSLDVLVLDAKGETVTKGVLILAFENAGLSFQEMAALAPLRRLYRPLELARENPLQLRRVPDVALKLQNLRVAAYDGTLVAGPKLFALKKGKKTTVVLRLVEGATLDVRIVDESGRPVAGVDVMSSTERIARKMRRTRSARPGDPAFGTTDADGRVTLRGLGAGQHDVRTRRDDAPWSRAQAVEVKEAGKASLTMVLSDR